MNLANVEPSKEVRQEVVLDINLLTAASFLQSVLCATATVAFATRMQLSPVQYLAMKLDRHFH